MFDNYMLVIAASGDGWPDTRKRAVLLHALGTEGQRLFYTLPNTGDTFAAAITALKEHFVPKVNVIAERHKFRQRMQRPDETVNQFLASLRELAATCEFGDMEDQMLRDQLIERVANTRIRDRLLLEPDLTLVKATTLALQIESGLRDANVLSDATAAGVSASVRVIQRQSKTSRTNRHGDAKKKLQNPAPAAAHTGTHRSCFRCGSFSHLANKPSCPAVGVKCNKCGKIGHFSRVCRSTQKEVREVVINEPTVLYMNNAVQDKILCTVQVTVNGQCKPVELIVDTGSSVSIIPENIYHNCFPGGVLTEPTFALVTYAKEKIHVKGCLKATISHDHHSAVGTLVVVESGAALLGLDLFQALQMKLEGRKVVTTNTQPTFTAHPAAPKTVLEDAASEVSVQEIGYAKNFIHKVHVLPNAVPVQQKLRRLPFAVRQAVSEELKDLQDKGIIERIDASPWVSPIVVTHKRDGGKPRICVDLREPNKVIVADCHPLPHMEELFSNLRGATVFSTIDLASAYHQMPLHPDSRDITAFITHDGLFRFCRVPFGLASAPSAFQKMMSIILAGLPGVQAYLDDVICYGTTQREHDENLRRVLRALTDAGLKLNMHKCKFNQPSLNYLGHTISMEGLLPDQDRVTAVIHAPAPQDTSSLRSFLGLASWYSKFIPDFATVSEPLRAVLRDCTDSSFKWTTEAQSSFTLLKELVVNSQALALYDPELPTYVTTDASDYGLGAVLTQLHPDQSERTVAFASRTLSPAERKYSTVEREALACVWAVERWRTYLWGRRFVLRTDHHALTTLLTSAGAGRAGLRIARWSARLLCFTYDVTYRPGHLNVTADCLSRLPVTTTHEETEEPDMIATVFKGSLCAISIPELTSASELCPELSLLRNQIQKGWPKCKQNLPENLAPFFQVRDELSVHGSLITRGPDRVVVPVSLRPRLVDLAHEGHQGIVRTKQRLRELFWWPQLDKLVQSVISSCVDCQYSDKVTKTAPTPLTPVEMPDAPWEKVAIDITGPFDTATWDCRYAIVLTDYYSKWPEVAFTSAVTTDVILRFLATVFSREGNPLYLVSDNGCQFTSHAFSEFLKARGIQHLRSSVYYPQANGAVERFNRVLKDCLQTCERRHSSWKEAVTEFLHNYRATPHATTGATPFELLRNRKMRTKLNILPVALKSKAHAQIKQRVIQKQNKMKEYTDKKKGAKTTTIKVGDTVRVRRPEHVHKGSSRFTEPRTVVKKVGQNTFTLSDGRKWNASKLAPFPTQALLGSEQTKDTVFDTVTLAENTNEATDILRRSRRARNTPRWLSSYVR